MSLTLISQIQNVLEPVANQSALTKFQQLSGLTAIIHVQYEGPTYVETHIMKGIICSSS